MSQIDWAYIQREWDWAGHIVEALVMAAIVTLIFRLILTWRAAGVAGLAFAAGHFHGREKRDYEISVQMPPPHLDGYLMWRWSWDQATDFWPTALVCLALIALIAYRAKRRK
ncbi:hypothetical protein NOF55_22930 [Rhizobiaceae bacterium BDR2-2]|uniref:Transmembrane protein n=1 Tax=Ectorhizobium quercum TaxID=2965071 RepID=A0AAE3N2Q4_9HYPH|nr:hypothetical protein [Ectorhizobium quercum]MCX8999963.1 hypothetical protein [Ectorhizobium quercum]